MEIFTLWELCILSCFSSNTNFDLERYPATVFVAFLVNMFLVRSLRVGFVLIKMIKNDFAKQQRDKERTTLLLHNIFPEQILSRYCVAFLLFNN